MALPGVKPVPQEPPWLQVWHGALLPNKNYTCGGLIGGAGLVFVLWMRGDQEVIDDFVTYAF